MFVDQSSLIEPVNMDKHGAMAGEAKRVRRALALMLDEQTHQDLAETFRALSDSTRAKIVYSLLWQDLCTTDLALILGISESAVSQHLRILRELRLVRGTRRGKMVFYSLDDDHVRLLLSVCLAHLRDSSGQPQRIGEVLGMMERKVQEEEHGPDE
jgi:DNA-binding transcriptional ArsR family regulator